ncbi:MAG TPA: ComF family protein [Cellulomonas sp.]
MAQGWWRAAGRDLLGLVLPVCCAGCAVDDVAWCARCAAALDRPAWRVEGRAGRLDRMDGRPTVPVWGVADFAGPVRRAVSAWKDHGRADLTPVLAAAARRAAGALADGTESASGSGSGSGFDAGTDVGFDAGSGSGAVRGSHSSAARGTLLVVPAPSTSAARRTRGWDPVGALAAAVADELTRRGMPARRAAVLRRAPGADQAGLSARARARNLSGHVRVRRWSRTGAGRAVLVDDVLTTGATFAACVRALERAGVSVLAGVVVASTPSPAGPVESDPVAR